MCFKGEKKSDVPKQFKSDSHTMSWRLKTVHFEFELLSRTSISMAWFKSYLRVMVQSMRTTFSSCQPASRSSLWSNLNLRACSVLLRHEMGSPSWGFAHSQSHAPQGGDRTKNSRQHKNDSGVRFLIPIWKDPKQRKTPSGGCCHNLLGIQGTTHLFCLLQSRGNESTDPATSLPWPPPAPHTKLQRTPTLSTQHSALCPMGGSRK